MLGWYPCIPGYHHDDVQRTNNGQPDYNNRLRSSHLITLINGDIAPTIFAEGSDCFELPNEGETVYKKWHKDVEKLASENNWVESKAPSNCLIFFDDRTFHKGSACVKSGWRWFGRITKYYKEFNTCNDDFYRISPPIKPTNEVRKQVQVYMSDLHEGW